MELFWLGHSSHIAHIRHLVGELILDLLVLAEHEEQHHSEPYYAHDTENEPEYWDALFTVCSITLRNNDVVLLHLVVEFEIG